MKHTFIGLLEATVVDDRFHLSTERCVKEFIRRRDCLRADVLSASIGMDAVDHHEALRGHSIGTANSHVIFHELFQSSHS
jgi:hypothetical protein